MKPKTKRSASDVVSHRTDLPLAHSPQIPLPEIFSFLKETRKSFAYQDKTWVSDPDRNEWEDTFPRVSLGRVVIEYRASFLALA
jgi:hypothetical protein